VSKIDCQALRFPPSEPCVVFEQNMQLWNETTMKSTVEEPER